MRMHVITKVARTNVLSEAGSRGRLRCRWQRVTH